MADDNEQKKDILSELTSKEQFILAQAIKRVETDIFLAVVKRFSYYLVAATGVLTLAGFLSFSTLKDGIKTTVVQQITGDEKWRLEVFNEILKAERDNSHAVSGFSTDLDEINSMIKQMKEDLAKRTQQKKVPTDKKGK